MNSIFLVMLFASLPVFSQVPAVPTLPQDLSGETLRYLSAKRDQFTASRSAFIAEGSTHNRLCRDVPLHTAAADNCAAAKGVLMEELADLKLSADALRVEIGAASGRKAVEVERRIERIVAELPKVDEIEGSAGAHEAHLAFAAAAKRDWPLALALWKTALQKDPTNESLKRSIELAAWMVGRPKQPAKPKAPSWTEAEQKAWDESIDSAERGDFSRSLGQVEAMGAKNPALFDQGDRLAAGILIEETLRSKNSQAAAPARFYPGDTSVSGELLVLALEAQVIGDYERAEQLFKESEFHRMGDEWKPAPAKAQTSGPHN